MTLIRTFSSIAALTIAAMAGSPWAAAADQRDGHRQQLATTGAQMAQAMPGNPGMGMRAGGAPKGYADQMNAMQQMHDKMLAAKTPEARNALMAEQMKLMQNGMNMMGGMGSMGGTHAGGSAGKPADMNARQDMMEQRMDMMQSMMQMMTDRIQSGPATQ